MGKQSETFDSQLIVFALNDTINWNFCQNIALIFRAEILDRLRLWVNIIHGYLVKLNRYLKCRNKTNRNKVFITRCHDKCKYICTNKIRTYEKCFPLCQTSTSAFAHDDVIKWKHFPRYWPFVRGIHRSSVNSPHKGQWRGALMFSLICA